MRYTFAKIIRWYRKRTRPHGATVRYAFPAVIALSAVVSFAATLLSDTSYVRISTVPKHVVAGEEITISVFASAHVPTNAVDLKIAYPEEQLDINSIDTGESVLTIWTEEPYAKDGFIHLRGGVFRKGFLGEHLVARIKARAIESGEAHIVASETVFLAGDGKGTAVAVTHTGSEKASVHIDEAGTLKSLVTIGIVTDIDGDGDVDISDIQDFLLAWRNSQSAFDFNGDGKMTFRDFGILLAHAFLR